MMVIFVRTAATKEINKEKNMGHTFYHHFALAVELIKSGGEEGKEAEKMLLELARELDRETSDNQKLKSYEEGYKDATRAITNHVRDFEGFGE